MSGAGIILDVNPCSYVMLQHNVLKDYPFIQQVDYLSFDVDDATVPAVSFFPWDRIRAKLITIEHDRYRVGDTTRNYIRHVLPSYGYTLACEDVMVDPLNDGNLVEYEDWWVDTNFISADRIKCKNTDGRKIHLMVKGE